MTFEDFKNIYESIPLLPGVYRFLDSEGKILYVGKAKNLRSRLSNYFGDKKFIPYKSRVLTKNASSIEFTIVETEHDALLLENTLIKKFQPRYNVSLKDAKSYSYIVIKNEDFPRVFFTRKVYKDGSTYFGPYTSKFRQKIILELLKKMFPLRSCSYVLSEENIAKKKFKVCLEYHIKNCKGACEGLETQEKYLVKIDQIKNILKGNFQEVKSYLMREIALFSEQMEFEKAQEMLEKMEYFEDYQAKSTVVSASIKDLDVFTYRSDEKLAYVNFMKIINGALINTDTVELEKNLNEEDEELLVHAILRLRETYNSIASEILTPFEVMLPEDITVTIPQRGDKWKLLELSQKNLDYYISQKKRQEVNNLNKATPAERILTTLKGDLHMDVMPLHIECFDNSNIQGTNPVGSCVVFKNAKPSNKDYRHFKIKTVEGPNDFASMKEVVYRRYSRLIEEGESLPQLIIIDGGKGQLSSAVESLEALHILDKVTVIGIAKKLEEIYFPGDSIP
ncbi:MAG TPA: excinuclease ABC subunit UvrC, partial [Saprospiraceae bacterium]|nr:excinuclease ABC subunit UvrC [Saprospiraceae bacterium]